MLVFSKECTLEDLFCSADEKEAFADFHLQIATFYVNCEYFSAKPSKTGKYS
jgi:hypothetical protein